MASQGLAELRTQAGGFCGDCGQEPRGSYPNSHPVPPQLVDSARPGLLRFTRAVAGDDESL